MVSNPSDLFHNIRKILVKRKKMADKVHELKTCDECKSEYYPHTSKMNNLCPECSYILCGYDNCVHEFINERCIKCFWDGSRSEYIKSLINLRGAE